MTTMILMLKQASKRRTGAGVRQTIVTTNHEICDRRWPERFQDTQTTSTEKPHVLKLYREELTILEMGVDEDVTDYISRAEQAATGLNAAGETITDNHIIAMLLKGLPETYKLFVVVHTQMDTAKTLTEFKAALRILCKHRSKPQLRSTHRYVSQERWRYNKPQIDSVYPVENPDTTHEIVAVKQN